MPHNKTRLWVGLAIVAVTIPAVGTYYIRAKDNGLQGVPIAVADRFGPTTAATQTAVVRSQNRDYGAELDLLLAKQASTTSTSALSTPTVTGAYTEDDDEFDIDPLPAAGDEPTMVDVAPDPQAIPNPASDLAPNDPTTVAAISGANAGGDQNQGAATQDPTVQNAPIGAGGNLSNTDVYRIVMSNLNDEDRTRFTQAYSAMSAEQRADLLDSFRAQMQGDNGQ